MKRGSGNVERWHQSCQLLRCSWWGAIPFSPHGKTQVITETAGYFWSRSFCKVSVEVAHASRGRRDCRGPRKEELEESTSQFPLPLENIKEVHSLHCGSTYRSVEWGESGATTSEESLHAEEAGDHNLGWRRTLPSSLQVSPPMRRNAGRVEHFSKTRAPPAFQVESSQVSGWTRPRLKTPPPQHWPSTVLRRLLPPHPFFLPLNLESKTQERQEQQRGKKTQRCSFLRVLGAMIFLGFEGEEELWIRCRWAVLIWTEFLITESDRNIHFLPKISLSDEEKGFDRTHRRQWLEKINFCVYTSLSWDPSITHCTSFQSMLPK